MQFHQRFLQYGDVYKFMTAITCTEIHLHMASSRMLVVEDGTINQYTETLFCEFF